MNIETLIESLEQLQREYDPNDLDHNEEENHKKADKLLLAYINDERVSRAFYKLKKWYS